MFRPQPTPYAPFVPYGAGDGAAPVLYPGYQYEQAGNSAEAGAGAASSAGGVGGIGGRGGAAGVGVGARQGSVGSGVVGGIGRLDLGGATSGAPTGAAAGGPASLPVLFSPVFQDAGADPAARFGAFNANTHTSTSLSHHRRQLVKMDALTDDLAAQEAAAREYQPQLEGPLVGDKTPSHIITEEYAKADPQYVRKTVALPQSYSHYRPIQGDGNCGWRAIGFSYFETLIRTGNRTLLESERLRITQTPIIGHDAFIFEDMREEINLLMKELSTHLNSPAEAQAILLQKFNDPEVANHILYYIRLLASSWLKGDPSAAEFIGFIPDGLGPQGYCQEFLELPGREIEHLGLIILANALLKPIGVVLEIAYLDRSPGPEVNTYRIPSEANGQDPSALGPIIYLLFRPDHYDILYRDPNPISPLDIQVNRATSFSHRHQITNNTGNLQAFSDVDFSPITLIPGFSSAGPGLHITVPVTSPLDSYSPSPQTPWMPSPFPGAGAVAALAGTEQYQTSVTPPIAVMQPPPPQQQPPQRRQTTTPPLRFSEYCHPSVVEAGAWQHEAQPTFSTATFKNSHFNIAHYNNPNFQPEEYRPDDEYVADTPPASGRTSGRKRSSG